MTLSHRNGYMRGKQLVTIMGVVDRTSSYREAANILGCSHTSISNLRSAFGKWKQTDAAFDFWRLHHDAKLEDELDTLRMEKRILQRLSLRLTRNQ